MAKKRTSLASCFGAALVLGLFGAISNIGGCGREPSATESFNEQTEASDKVEADVPLEQAREVPAPQPENRVTLIPPSTVLSDTSSPPSSANVATRQTTDPFTVTHAAAVAALIPTPQRKWTSLDGRAVLGSVTRFDPTSDTVTLKTAAAETFESLPLSRFSEADQNYLREAANGRLTGKVVGVADGDSFTLLIAGNTQFKIRLESIDAPEIGQEFGNNAKAELGRLIHEKEVTVAVSGLDKYKRVLGWVSGPDGQNINLLMVAGGLAWNYVEYSKSAELAKAESEARDAKTGLWRDWKPMPPWDWRDLQKRNAALAVQPLMGIGSAGAPSATPPSDTGYAKPMPAVTGGFWLNTSSGKRHNQSCRHFGNTKSGRACSNTEGSACGICGG